MAAREDAGGLTLPWRIEEVCFRAFPAIEEVRRGAWLLRFAGGVSRRANSLNPLAAACPDIAAAIAAAEQAYPARGLPVIVRVPSIVSPALDRELAARGYREEGESCVLYAPIAEVAATPDAAVRLLDIPEPHWLAAMARLQAHSPAQSAAYREITQRVAVPARFALLEADGEPAALAFGALHDGLLGYESVIVAPQQRRRGLARRVLAALADWARGAGAAGVCLQVEARNTAARPLYAGFGMHEVYRYRYRRQPSG